MVRDAAPNAVTLARPLHAHAENPSDSWRTLARLAALTWISGAACAWRDQGHATRAHDRPVPVAPDASRLAPSPTPPDAQPDTSAPNVPVTIVDAILREPDGTCGVHRFSSHCLRPALCFAPERTRTVRCPAALGDASGRRDGTLVRRSDGTCELMTFGTGCINGPRDCRPPVRFAAAPCPSSP